MFMDASGSASSIFLLGVIKQVDPSMVPEIVLYGSLMLVCLTISAICAASENAFFSHRESDIEELRSSISPISKIIIQLLDRPKHLLATILLLNSLVNVAFVLMSIVISEKFFDLEAFPWFKFFIEAIVVTIIILVFGEVMPKVFATQHYKSSARFLVYPMRVFVSILWPLTHLLVKFGSVLERKNKPYANELTPEELSRAIDMASDEEDAQQEKEILKGIVNMGSIQVKQIMRSRVDMVAISEDVQYHAVLQLIRDKGFSRMPVYSHTLDKIKGVLNIKNLIPHLDQTNDFRWQQFVSAPYFIPENKAIDDTLQEMRNNRIHIAIVVDEFGGTSGIITMEDILDEVFGDMQDEFDELEKKFEEINQGVYMFEGKKLLVDFVREVGLPIDVFDDLELESDSLGGMITERLGRMPKRGDAIVHAGIGFTVELADQRRVKKVKIDIHSDAKISR